MHFNPQGSREPRRLRRCVFFDCTHISIHKALASLDSATQGAGIELYISIHKALASLDLYCYRPRRKGDDISIHKALASLDHFPQPCIFHRVGFQSTRLSRASTWASAVDLNTTTFQSTRLSRASTCCSWKYFLISCKFQSTRLSRASTVSVPGCPE